MTKSLHAHHGLDHQNAVANAIGDVQMNAAMCCSIGCGFESQPLDKNVGIVC
jgi:hypothetical protein